MTTPTTTFDVYFDDSNDSNNKGFQKSYEECLTYINACNGSSESYFKDYKGGTVSIVNNETGETVYETEVL